MLLAFITARPAAGEITEGEEIVPPDLFGATWDDLTLSHVDRLLADSSEETLTWEAKSDGANQLGPQTIRKAVCGFANSERGGYLILGAELINGAYTLTGLSHPPAAELGSWVDQLVRSGMHPVPRLDHKAWSGRPNAAIIAIDPVEEPPCLTTTGAVYIRTSGRTVPVNDSGDLARLFSLGRSFRQQRAIEAAGSLILRAVESRSHLLRNPPTPPTQEELRAELQDWTLDVVQFLDAELPGRSAALLAARGGGAAYAGPVWRSNLVTELEGRLDRLVEFQTELARSFR